MHGAFDVTIPIRNNRLVLVGVNGLGKSTCINALYAVLSRQWSRLLQLQFDAIELDTDGSTIRIARATIESDLSNADDKGGVPTGLRRRIDILRAHDLLDAFVEAREEDLPNFVAILDIPPSAVSRLQRDARHARGILLEGDLAKVAEEIRSLLSGDQILYFPTYRRIEKELKSLLPDFDDTRYRRDPLPRMGARTDAYVELVEFGMDDVNKRLTDTLADLNNNNRKEFSTLAGSYLRDVIRGVGNEFSVDEIRNLTDDAITDILRRVEENTLSENDKLLLRTSVNRLRDVAVNTDEKDAYVAHFLAKLVQASKNLIERERIITTLVSVCNRYLDGKTVIYDELKYSVTVIDRMTGRRIELQHLSSGEKQVVSLLTHLYLHGDRKVYIIIDEPELSLSVPWQRTLLPDLWLSGHCSFMAAVTHSPFIFDNEFQEYVVDLRDHITYHG